MVLIMTDDAGNEIGERLRGELQALGAQAELLPLGGVRVQPCVNCGTCTKRTPGRCATRDDGDWIYPKVAEAEALVVVTPVVFGGYSARVKRVLDKFGLFMDSHYFVENGELVKGGLIGRRFRYFAVGLGEMIGGEAEVFLRLVHETILLTRGTGRALFARDLAGAEALREFAAEVANA